MTLLDAFSKHANQAAGGTHDQSVESDFCPSCGHFNLADPSKCFDGGICPTGCVNEVHRRIFEGQDILPSPDPSICQDCERKKESYMNEMVCFFCLYQMEKSESDGKNTIILFLVGTLICLIVGNLGYFLR